MAEYQILVPPPRRHRTARIVVVIVVVVAAVAAGAFVIGRHSTGGGQATSARGGGTTAAAPLTLVSSVPANGATDVPSNQVVSVHLSAPVVAGSGVPTFNPPVSGSWLKVGPDSLSFAATAPFIPTSTETLVIPGGASGLRSVDGRRLAAPATITFTVAQASTERLQQLLAQLNFLPLSFTPSGSSAPAQATTAQPGTFAWRWPGLPSTVTSLWTEGIEDVITKGAVMNFENQHGLTVDGLAGKDVWSALLADVASGKVNADPYVYVLVSKQLPENLTLYENGAPTMAN
ncbi:MAG TPA: Ig-like domain-containing protein, partial [Acidimicrobiales bacterium]|nr:Ig-like domain-containing protein [Acidimicrobiales bacterium]